MLERASYGGWHDAYVFSNGTVELVVLADVGPRVISYGFTGEESLFHEVPGDAGAAGGNEFRLYGGHRLWVWPETARTYFPDNRAVRVSSAGNRARFTAEIEDAAPGTRLQKELEITLDEVGTKATLHHRVTNHDSRPAELAVWCPTMCRAGGRAILPLPPRVAMDPQHYQSIGPLTLWSFTDLADPRWSLGTEFIQLRQDPQAKGRFPEQMAGLYNTAGWGAYYSRGTLFVKQAAVVAAAAYPDFGCNFAVFTNSTFLELETLAPRVSLKPGDSATHTEVWTLHRDVPTGEDEDWVRSEILPLAPRASEEG
jgi:hypothetical protein